jgi:hypothetical protein
MNPISEVIVNTEQCKLIGRFLREKRKGYKYYMFDDPRENPDSSLGIETNADYYTGVINLDAHFWRIINGEIIPDYGLVNGQRLKGATFLWTKSKIMLDKDSNFFSPKNLANLSSEKFREWLSDDTGQIPIFGPETRLDLTRQLGSEFLKHYERGFNEIYKQSRHRLLWKGFLGGLFTRFEIFDGYRDWPFYKKANLLAKIMERRGFWKFEDPENKDPPINYHLPNIAYKTGTITPGPNPREKIKNRKLLGSDEEFQLRLAVVKAYRIVAERSGIDPYKIDDDAWNEGREYCQDMPPNCDGVNKKRPCFFRDVCAAYNTDPSLKELSIPLVDTFRY